MLACYWNIEAVSQSIYSLLEINKKNMHRVTHLAYHSRCMVYFYILPFVKYQIGPWFKSKTHQWILWHVIMSLVLPCACITRPCSALLYLALHRGLLENLKGFWNQTSGETRIQKHFFFHKTGTEQKENPQTEMREFHKLPFVAK